MRKFGVRFTIISFFDDYQDCRDISLVVLESDVFAALHLALRRLRMSEQITISEISSFECKELT